MARLMRYIDGASIFTSVNMMRQNHKGAFLLVEGSKDNRIFRRFISGECEIIDCTGRDKALEAIDLLEEGGFLGVVCFIDCDFDVLDELESGSSETSSSNLDGLILADDHDIDVTIFNSQALSLYLGEVGDKNKIDGIGIHSIRKMVFDSVYYLGYCRWASWRRELQLNFKDLDFGFIDKSNLNVDESMLRNIIIENSNSPRCSEGQLMSIVDGMLSDKYPISHVCNGHDVARALGIALREKIGNRNETKTRGDEIELGLRLAFDYEIFQTTNMYSKFKKWETDNPGYRLLRPIGNLTTQ